MKPTSQQETKLTDLEWEVYRIVKEHPSVTQEEICSIATGDGFDLKYAPTAKHGDHCRKLWDIVQRINYSDEVDEVIVADCYTYRIGTKEEVWEYADWLIKKVSLLSKRYHTIVKKYLRNGQVKLSFNGSDEVDVTEAFRGR